MPKTVLLVDDDPATLALSRLAFAKAGHAVTVASNGLQALRKLDAETFDVIVTDVFMPDMDGLELIRHVRGSGREIPVIAISAGCGSTSMDFLPIAAALGADHVLRKPFAPSELVRAVETVKVARSTGLRAHSLRLAAAQASCSADPAG